MRKFMRNLVASVLAATALGAYAQSAAAQSPPNDNFANATVITGPRGIVTGSTAGATGETGEPTGSSTLNTVWFRYTPETSGGVTFHGFGSNFIHEIRIFTGSAVNALTNVASSSRVTTSAFASFVFEAGTTYHIRIDGSSSDTGNYVLNWGSGPVAAVLPQARAVPIGTTATAFATILNPTDRLMRNCRIGWTPFNPPAGTFSYQTTNPTTNVATGTQNTPVDIPAGGLQTFVFGFQPSAQTTSIFNYPLQFRCDDEPMRLPDNNGLVNTFSIYSDTTATPDIVALAASTTPGYVVLTQTTGGTGSAAPATVPFQGAFAVASINLGAAGTVGVRPTVPRAFTTEVDPTVTVCETNPTTGVCLAPAQPTLSVNFAANATPTFAVFLQSNSEIPDNATLNRVFLDFTQFVGSDTVILGRTSVAVRTAAPAN